MEREDVLRRDIARLRKTQAEREAAIVTFEIIFASSLMLRLERSIVTGTSRIIPSVLNDKYAYFHRNPQLPRKLMDLLVKLQQPPAETEAFTPKVEFITIKPANSDSAKDSLLAKVISIYFYCLSIRCWNLRQSNALGS